MVYLLKYHCRRTLIPASNPGSPGGGMTPGRAGGSRSPRSPRPSVRSVLLSALIFHALMYSANGIRSLREGLPPAPAVSVNAAAGRRRGARSPAGSGTARSWSGAGCFVGQDRRSGLPAAAGRVRAAAGPGQRVGLGMLPPAGVRGLLGGAVFTPGGDIRDSHLWAFLEIREVILFLQ